MPHETSDVFSPLRAAVPDPLTFRVVRNFCENRRQPGTSLADAVAHVVRAIGEGRLPLIIRAASKPEAVWREQNALQQLILRAVSPYSKQPCSDAVLASIRSAIIGVCAARYPKHERRYITRIVRSNTGYTLRRLEIHSEAIVAALAGLAAN